MHTRGKSNYETILPLNFSGKSEKTECKNEQTELYEMDLQHEELMERMARLAHV